MNKELAIECHNAAFGLCQQAGDDMAAASTRGMTLDESLDHVGTAYTNLRAASNALERIYLRHRGEGRFSVFVPWVSSEHRTEWHPTEPDGPFAVLCRGSYETEAEAIAWAREHLNGTPYTIKRT